MLYIALLVLIEVGHGRGAASDRLSHPIAKTNVLILAVVGILCAVGVLSSAGILTSSRILIHGASEIAIAAIEVASVCLLSLLTHVAVVWCRVGCRLWRRDVTRRDSTTIRDAQSPIAFIDSGHVSTTVRLVTDVGQHGTDSLDEQGLIFRRALLDLYDLSA